jgi:hypothetical protein
MYNVLIAHTYIILMKSQKQKLWKVKYLYLSYYIFYVQLFPTITQYFILVTFYVCCVYTYGTDNLYIMTVRSIFIDYVCTYTIQQSSIHTNALYCAALVRNRTICFHMMQFQMYTIYIYDYIYINIIYSRVRCG